VGVGLQNEEALEATERFARAGGMSSMQDPWSLGIIAKTTRYLIWLPYSSNRCWILLCALHDPSHLTRSRRSPHGAIYTTTH